MTPWGMRGVKTSTGCLSLPLALPPVWREETPPSNLAPVFTSPHVPVPSSQLFIGHTSPPLEQEPWEALYLVSPTWVWRTVGAQQTPAHVWEASFGESVGSTKVVMGFCSWDQCGGGETHRVLKHLNLVTFFFFLIQSPEMMCACFWKVGAVLFQGPTSVDCTSLQGEPTPTPRAFLKRRTPDTSQLFPALPEWAVHTLYPLTQSSLKPVWWVLLLPHFKAQEARGEGGWPS